MMSSTPHLTSSSQHRIFIERRRTSFDCGVERRKRIPSKSTNCTSIEPGLWGPLGGDRFYCGKALLVESIVEGVLDNNIVCLEYVNVLSFYNKPGLPRGGSSSEMVGSSFQLGSRHLHQCLPSTAWIPLQDLGYYPLPFLPGSRVLRNSELSSSCSIQTLRPVYQWHLTNYMRTNG